MSNATFPGRLREAREKAGMSQEALARRLEMSGQTLYRYEAGRSRPDMDTLKSIAFILGVSAASLLGEKPATPKAVDEVA